MRKHKYIFTFFLSCLATIIFVLEFEDTKGATRIVKSKKDRQHNEWPKEKGQKEKERPTNR
jgi:hypothetical protein